VTVPKLARFNTPADVRDAHPDAWSARLRRLHAPLLDGSLPNFFDPTRENTPAGAASPMVSWTAFPARLLRGAGSPQERWRRADRDRQEMDEYCEWAVTRNAARKITRVTFTTEVVEYYEHLFETAPDKLLRLYRRFAGPQVSRAHLRTRGGDYKPINRWNRGNHLAHLIQVTNTLGAAITLVGQATVLRTDDGRPVTNQQELVRCAGLGDPRRNSDPQIASAVNVAVGEGADIALADPLGLYLGRPLTAGMVTPDGADAARFWRIERGDTQHTLRARFEVPPTRDYVVGDIEINDRPIQFGAQVADRVPVWIKVVVKPGKKPKPQPCTS
jgi:hypothetical protein